ncbi:MAG: DUF192 domain-containing protein [Gemmatimonadetes bacterium]|nr:DUF192 domain-containing protein [Gemmatimonadota bacterium]NNM07438.1 DUF192 domain-containing protein [Gemmatimonadota bacterium]
MRITNRTRNTLLGSRVDAATSWWQRLRGYIGRTEPKRGEGILLVECNAIHTWWMTFSLDVVFLDQKGKVLDLIESIRPWKRTRRIPGARYVLEVPVGTIEYSGTRLGDHLTWREPAPYSISIPSSGGAEDYPAPGGRGRKSV